MTKSNRLNHLLIISTMLLLVFGLIALISASAVIGEQTYGDVYHFVKKQLFLGIFLGLIFAWIVSKINYRSLAKFSIALLIFNIFLLLLCFIPALQPIGSPANRWLKIAFINFQPSEFIKLTYILFLASLLSHFSLDKRRKMYFKPFIVFICSLAIIGVIIIKQPATGTLVVLAL